MNVPLTANSLPVFLFACVVKATIVWAVAICAATILRRASAASRHFVWATAILASLTLPLFSMLLPVWRSTTLTYAERWLPSQPAVAAQSSQSISPMIVDVVRVASSAFHAGTWIIALWALGAGIVASRLVFGLLRTTLIARKSQALCDKAWIADVAEIANSFHIRRPVRLLQSSDPAGMPLTWGLLYPTILLPLGITAWTSERRRIVLFHEFAHIARADWFLQICAELSRALYWFHPLAWTASAALRHESERACDDAVLNSGVSAEDYAGELLALARSLVNSPASVCPALAIARPTNLERRFAAMLNPSLDHRSSHRNKVLTAIAALCFLLPLAAIRLPAQDVSVFTGTIYDASGAVVPNATVILNDASSKSIGMSSSAGDGRFTFKSVPAGEYEFKVMKLGFEIYRDPQLNLKASQARTLDVHLKVGTISESVDVHAEGHAHDGAAKPVSRVKIGGEIEASKLVTKVQPIYPESAKAAGIQGKVVLHAVIGMDGAPLSLQVVNADADPELARASIEAVSRWRYSPTLLNGQPIEVDTVVVVNFTLAP
jgi:TonB family protein